MNTIKTPDYLVENLAFSTNNKTVTTPKLNSSVNTQTQTANNSLLTTPQLPPSKVFTPWKAPEEKAFDANTDAAALRKQWKEELMAKGMKRRDAKNQATLLVNLRILELGNNASQSQKDWMNARAKLYTVDSNGNITRNKSNFWNIFGTIMGGLTLGPTGAIIANSTIPRHLKATPTTNWGTSTLDSIKPSLEFLDAEARIKLAASQKTPVVQEAPTAQATSTVNNSDGTPVVAVKPPVVTQPSWIDNPDNAYAKKYYGFNSANDIISFLKALKSQNFYSGDPTGSFDSATRTAYKNAKQAGYVRKGTTLTPWYSRFGNGTLNGNIFTVGNTTYKYNPKDASIVKRTTIPRTPNGVTINNMRVTFKNGVGSWNGLLYRRGSNGKLLYNNFGKWLDYRGNYKYFKQGGKFQQGGSMTQEDLQEQLLTAATLGMIGYANANLKAMDFTTAVSQIMELALTKPETLQEIASNEELVKAGIEIMKQLEPEVLEMVSKPGGLRKILAQLKNKTKMAKQGSKLEYIQKLRGICPEGYEMSYMKAGGKVCPVCKKKSKKAQNGTKMLDNGMPVKKMGGAISELMNQIKYDIFKCGGKVKKAEAGAEMDDKKTKKITKVDDKTVLESYTSKWVDPESHAEYRFPNEKRKKEYIALVNKFLKSSKSMTQAEKDSLSAWNAKYQYNFGN